MQRKRRLGDILVESGAITQSQLEKALAVQKKTRMKLGETLVEEKILTEEKLLKVLEYQLGIPYLNLNEMQVDKKAVNLINRTIAKKYNVIPVKMQKGKLILAMSDPLDILAIDDVRLISGMDVDVAIASKADIQKAINANYSTSEVASKAAKEFSEEMKQNTVAQQQADEEDAGVTNAPMVRLVNSIIAQAATLNASDIHIEPFENLVRIRYRIDGDLQEVMTLIKIRILR